MVGTPPVSESIKDLELAATAKALDGDYVAAHQHLSEAWLYLADKGEQSATLAIQNAEVLHTGGLIAVRSAMDPTLSADEAANRLNVADRRYNTAVSMHTGPYVNGQFPIRPPKDTSTSELRNDLLGLHGKGLAGLGLTALAWVVTAPNSKANVTAGRSRIEAARVFKPWMYVEQKTFLNAAGGILAMVRSGSGVGPELPPPIGLKDELFAQVIGELSQRVQTNNTAAASHSKHGA